MKKKKLAALLLAGAMGLGLLAGCSNGGKPENGGGDAVTIKVGGIGPTTGDNAQYGTATEWGAEIAVEEINADNKYKLIINASALIDADTTLNITPAVLAKVNELYAADKNAEKK